MKSFAEVTAAEIMVGHEAVAPNPCQRILVVEDHKLVRQLSVKALLTAGYEVDAAEDGAVGWEALQAGKHDLLVTDNNMPKMTGIELVKKARIARMSMPAVLVSGAMPTAELEEHPWLGITAVLEKPFSQKELLATVKLALNARDHDHDDAGVPVSIPTAKERLSMQPPDAGPSTCDAANTG